MSTTLPQHTGSGTVVMAVYRPRLDLLKRQICSLQDQTVRDWTCIVGIDGVDQDARANLLDLVRGDIRFRVKEYPERVGHYRNFERLLAEVPAESTWVALSDQDDLWAVDKLHCLLSVMSEERVSAALAQARVVDESGNVLSCTNRKVHGLGGLILNNSMTGSMMIVDQRVVAVALPFPPGSSASYHDHWLGVCAAALGDIIVLTSPLQDYVQHGGNVIGEQLPPLLARARALIRQGPRHALDLVVSQRWGWRVEMARAVSDRVPTTTGDPWVATIASGASSQRLVLMLAMTVWRRSIPLSRALSLLIGSMYSRRMRSGSSR